VHTSRTRQILASLVYLVLAACETGTEPGERRPNLALNTMAIHVSGPTTSLSSTVTARGGFQHITSDPRAFTASGGMYIYANPQGLPFAISFPGFPEVGEAAVGRWDPRAVYLREEGELSADPVVFARHRPIMNVARPPSIAFGEHVAAVLGAYVSIPGGVLTIDEIDIPDRRDFTGIETVRAGAVRGRMSFRAARDSLLTSPGAAFSHDTLDIVVDFSVELENWPDGRAAVHFTDGPLSALPPLRVVGSATDWARETNPELQLVIGLGGVPYENGDVLTLWFGTRLSGSGSAPIEAMDADLGIGPDSWPDHFVAGTLASGSGGERVLRSVGGTIDLQQYEPSTDSKWGEVHGTLNVELSMQTGSTFEQVTVAVSFHVPLGYLVEFCAQTCPITMRMHSGVRADLRLWQP
jgi:hypothetical protein